MKFPSIKTLTEGAKNTITRFPLELCFALIGTIAAIVYIELSRLNRPAESWCIRLILMANLGLLLTLSATLYTESRGITGKQNWLIKIVAVAVAIFMLFILKPAEREGDWVRFFLICLALHLLVAYAAFTQRERIQGFWQFNKSLFLRFLTSVLYSGVLYAGIAAALGAGNFLFNFNFEWDTFAILAVWIAGIFCTLFFLAAVPVDFDALDEDTSYPKGLKIFTQYVLIPLASLYLIILLAYETRILINWNLPKGYVSNIILGYAVFGILALLLVYPIRDREENKWIKTYTKSFYFLMLPLLVLLFLATGTRIFSYGITVPRYFLMMLAIWLLFISLYFLIAKKQNIKLIPISLSVLTLLTIYGPQSAFSISEYSQVRILVNLFKKNNAFKNGKLQPIKNNNINKKDGNKAVVQLEYVVGAYDIFALQPYISADLQAVSDSLGRKKNQYRDGILIDGYMLRNEKRDWVQKYLGLEKFSRWDMMDEIDYSWSFKSPNDTLNVKNYDYLMNADVTDTLSLKLNGNSFRRALDDKRAYLYSITADNETVKFNVNDLIKELLKRGDLKKYNLKHEYYEYGYSLPQEFLMQTKTTNKFKITLILSEVTFKKEENGKKGIFIWSSSARYLIKKLK